MKRLLQTLYLTASIIGVTPAHADSYVWLCRDHHKNSPVTLDTGQDDDCSGSTTPCTITWRGVTWRNVKQGEDCKANYLGTENGVDIDLCTATQGVADLTVGKESFDCQMPRSKR